ncbi:unnamed protein product [Sympodiomycopsis kandeliae]
MSTWNKHYHWKTKGCTAWSKDYFSKNFLEQSLTLDSGEVLKVTRLDSFEGDVELGNRKGKLITIYDLDVSLKWSATSKEEEVAGGKIRFPEISHEIEDQDDEYTWETELESEIGNGSRNDKDKIYQSVRKNFIEKQLIPILKSFRSTLIDTHARDLGHDGAATGSSSGTATPSSQPAAGSSSSATKTAATSTVKTTSTTKSKVAVSDEVIELEGSNACSKADLWDILTNQARIPMWTRSPAEFVPLPDHKFSLFNGNVTGKVLSVSSPNEITSSWRPPTWEPSDHFGTLKLQLVEKDESTLLKIRLEGVPQGQEEASKRALEEFYLNGLRRLGLGSMI